MNDNNGTKHPDYEKNIFINCPFDKNYEILLKPMIFTILYFGYEPKLASESSDCAELRIIKIKDLINESKYGIHDISRIEYSKTNPFPRFNMPLELGLDLGSKYYSGENHSEKKYLILEKEKFRFKQYVSDLSGVDIKNHEEKPEKLVRELRNWFYDNVFEKGSSFVSPGSIIWESYNEFYADLQIQAKLNGFSDDEFNNMPFSEFKNYAKEWISSLKKVNPIKSKNKRITSRSTRPRLKNKIVSSKGFRKIK